MESGRHESLLVLVVLIAAINLAHSLCLAGISEHNPVAGYFTLTAVTQSFATTLDLHVQLFERLRMSSFFLTAGGIFYQVDCLVPFRQHPELAWSETGIYAGGPAGFYLTVGFIVVTFGYLIFGKGKQRRSYTRASLPLPSGVRLGFDFAAESGRNEIYKGQELKTDPGIVFNPPERCLPLIRSGTLSERPEPPPYGDAWKWTFGVNVPAWGEGT
jgi:hypothetical protein